MSAGPRDDAREPVLEDRAGGESPTIAEAADDVARTVLRDRDLPADADVPEAPDDPSDPPVADGPVNSA